MPGLFDDLPNAPAQSFSFDDLPDSKPSFGNVQAGSMSAPSFGNVQSGVQQASNDYPPLEFEGLTPQSTADASSTLQAADTTNNQIAELPGAALTGLEQGSEGLGKTLGLATAGVAGLFDDIAGTNTQDAVFKSLVQPYDEAQQYHAAQLAKMGTPAQVVGGVTSAVPDLALGLASGGESAALTASEGLTGAILSTVNKGVQMAAPLATKAAAESYGQAIADGKAPWDATTDALHAIASTSVMGVLGGSAEGNILSRMVQSGAASAGTSEAIRELEGRPFSGAELGTNLALGAAFGVPGGHGRRPGDINITPDLAKSADEISGAPENRPPSPENVPESGSANPELQKTESKISDLQSAKEADATQAQSEAWGEKLFGDVASTREVTPKEPVQETTGGHDLFNDLVPGVSAPEGVSAPAKEIGRWDTDFNTGQRTRAYDREDLKKAVESSNLPVTAMRDFQAGDLTVGKLFDHIANDTSGRVEPQMAQLAGYLSAAGKRFGGLDVKIGRYDPENIVHTEEKPASRMNSGGGKAAGYYDPFNNAIRIDRDAPNQHLLLHEAAHALTNRAVIRGKAGKLGGDAQKAYDTFNTMFEGFRNHMESTGSATKDANGNWSHYGLTNLDEYLAEFYTSPKFREALKNVKLDDITPKSAGGFGRAALGAVRNVYEATVRGIKNMLRLPDKAETALDASFAAGHQFLGNLKPEHLEGIRGLARRTTELPEMVSPSREDIDAQAKRALAAGADPEKVAERIKQLYAEHGHDINQGHDNGPAPTSTKNAVRDAERLAEGRDPIVKAAAQSNAETIKRAQAAMDANPQHAAEVVNKALDEGVNALTATEEATLLLHKVGLRNERDAAVKIALDPAASDHAKQAAQMRYGEAEAQIARLDEATEASGREWGRMGQFRQQMMRADYSLESMQRRARVAKGSDLTPEEHARIKSESEGYEKAKAEADKAQAAVDADHAGAVKQTYQSLVKEMVGQLKAARKSGKFVEKLKSNADESRDWIRKNFGLSKSSAGIDPTVFYHLARIGAYHIANGAVKFKDWVVKMKAEFGDNFSKVEKSLPAVFEAAKAQHDLGATGVKPRMRAKKEIDPNNITHKDVYDLARAHIINGVHGEDAVMKAVHGDLKEHGLSERDVRRLFSEYGEAKFPSKAADKTELREIRALVQMQESIDRIHEGLPALKSGVQRDKATQLVREKRRQLNDLLKAQEAKNGLSPEKLVTYQEMRKRNLENQIEDLTKELATGEKKVRQPTPPDSEEVVRLKAVRDDLRKQLKAIEEAKNPPLSPEEKYQQQRGKSLQRQLEDIYKRIENNDYEKRTRPDRDLSVANQKAQYKLYQAKNLFLRHQFELSLKNRTPLAKIFGAVGQTLNLARAVMTSFDLSATLRQGGFIALGHPVRAIKALMTSLSAARGEEYAFRAQREIEQRPNFFQYKKAGLHLGLGPGHELNNTEEQFMSRWIEGSLPGSYKRLKQSPSIKNAAKFLKDIPLAPVRGSERAFKSFLNKLRADSFDAMIGGLAKNGKEPTKEEAKAIANYINVATGRGHVGSNKKVITGLNGVFFAPRLVASRFNLLAGQPMYGGTARTKAMVAGEYARFLMGVGAVYALGAAAHAAFYKDDNKHPFIEVDPRSANFGKMQFGENTFIDPLAGLAQVSTFVGREALGQTKTTKGKINPLRQDYKPLDKSGKGPVGIQSTGGDVLFRFARTKLAPIPGAVVNFLVGKDITGQKFSGTTEAADLTTPMSLQNIYYLMKEHGVPAGTAMTLADLLGMSVQYRQNYNQPKQKKDNGH